jgi:hypothetical protein
VVVVVGELYALVGRTTEAVVAVDVTGSIAFGVVLGPHVAFGGGAAAVAYAHRRGYLDTEFDYHPAKEVTRGLGSRPDVLAVGGAFGVLGFWVATLAGSLGVPVAPVALGVVGSALAHRLVFGYSLLGAGFGLLGALLSEVAQRVFYAHAETHLDPPAASIVLTSLVVAVLAVVGVFPQGAWVPLP